MKARQLELPCPHYWLIDSDNKGRCKYCNEERDFHEINDKVFGNTKKYFAKGITLERNLCPTNGYYMQGDLRHRHSYKLTDFSFSVDGYDDL